MKRIATLPAALRTMLSAAKAGATRFVVVADPVWKLRVRQALEETGRMPAAVDWFEAPDDESCLAAILREILQRSPDRVVLAAGDRLFHPSLVRRAVEWTGSGLLTLMGGTQLTGAYALSGKLLRDIIDSVPREIQGLDELYYWLATHNCVSFETIDQKLWQAVHKPGDLSETERKLNHWLHKKTDGLFARLNRKLSIPISRQLIRIPITPNLVTIARLGGSALSGVFFALGGYLHALTGAVLSWAASVLDGCDGKVARLTHQESDFGCWLETLCDYLLLPVRIHRDEHWTVALVGGENLPGPRWVAAPGRPREHVRYRAPKESPRSSRPVFGGVAGPRRESQTRLFDVVRKKRGVPHPAFVSSPCHPPVCPPRPDARSVYPLRIWRPSRLDRDPLFEPLFSPRISGARVCAAQWTISSSALRAGNGDRPRRM